MTSSLAETYVSGSSTGPADFTAVDVSSILSHMANKEARLSDVFYALADPTRRAIVGALGAGPAPVSVLATSCTMALPSFMKHVAVLERCGLIHSSKLGRVRTCVLKPRKLALVDTWLADQRVKWEAHTDRLAVFAERLHQENLHRDKSDRRG